MERMATGNEGRVPGLTVNGQCDPLGDGWGDVVTGDAQVGAHFSSSDLCQL